MGNNEGKLRRNFISLPPEVSVWKEFHTGRCQCRSPPPLANVTISARHVSGNCQLPSARNLLQDAISGKVILCC